MCKKLFFSLILFFLISPKLSYSQDEPEQLGLPGDNLNLYAVLKVFEESETLEAFERALNAEDNKINNLDLDEDDKIDYIRVIDDVDGDVHNISLKVSLGEKDEQSVAVIVVRKLADGKADIQVIGDEDLYGKDYIIEPRLSDDTKGETPNPGYKGNEKINVSGTSVAVEKNSTQQVAKWPVVQVIFMPSYVVYRSPWYWGYYPPYWNPWRPHYWHYYYGYHYHWHYHYYSHYHHYPYYRNPTFQINYYSGGRRSRSNVYQSKLSQGSYKKSYTRPELAKEGSASFVKKYPKAPSATAKLPAFDKSNNYRPIVSKPAVKPSKPSARPTRPTTKPGVSRPITKPNPGARPTRPVTKPSVQPSPKPITRPSVTPSPKPVPKPGARPARPQTGKTREG